MGETFEIQEGCNKCTCLASRTVSCTENPLPCRCRHKGRLYGIGDAFEEECNTCTCRNDGSVRCTQEPCFCQYQGRRINVGSTFTRGDLLLFFAIFELFEKVVKKNSSKKSLSTNFHQPPIFSSFSSKYTKKKQGCNTCVCKNTGRVECENKNCMQEMFCVQNNKRFNIGATIEKECNTCVCKANGKFLCGNKPCNNNSNNCIHNGKSFRVGEVFSRNNCEKCVCRPDGKVSLKLKQLNVQRTAFDHCLRLVVAQSHTQWL